MRKRHKIPWNPRQGAVQRPRISRRHFLGGLIGIGTARSWALVLNQSHEERLSLHEADYYRIQDLAG